MKAKKDGFKEKGSAVMKHPKDASKLKKGEFKKDESMAKSRLMEFPNSEDKLPGNELEASAPARSGHHVLSSHDVTMLHDGHEDNGDAGEAMEDADPVGPRQSSKKYRGY